MNFHAKYELYTEDMFEVVSLDCVPPFLLFFTLRSRWTTQRNMMGRLLQLKDPVVEYFRRNSNDKRRLTSHDWNVPNQVCSILDPIAKVNIKLQGAEDTYISQATLPDERTDGDHDL